MARSLALHPQKRLAADRFGHDPTIKMSRRQPRDRGGTVAGSEVGVREEILHSQAGSLERIHQGPQHWRAVGFWLNHSYRDAWQSRHIGQPPVTP